MKIIKAKLKNDLGIYKKGEMIKITENFYYKLYLMGYVENKWEVSI